MKVYVSSFEAKHLTASDMQWYSKLGLEISIEGDPLPVQEPPVEESIGQDENGNEIFVPVEYGND